MHNRRIYADALDGYGLHGSKPARPAPTPHPVFVHRLALLFHASSRCNLAATPLRFSILHLHQVGSGTCTLKIVEHARHTWKTACPNLVWRKKIGEGRSLRDSTILLVIASCISDVFAKGPARQCGFAEISAKAMTARFLCWRCFCSAKRQFSAGKAEGRPEREAQDFPYHHRIRMS